ncbi:unnamed protein product [Mytilus coruscus]|uniref:YqaJ viral recombinase domain-containing protein n=1 Tax=Mytilus coruscus TaxID=42192 RepID=A0A6J8CX76_MYTCO|nr:unnamed protein product [Mytilus coruscus]
MTKPTFYSTHINKHGDHESTFSMRKSIFDEKLGCFAYRSLHFPARISVLKSYHERGYIFNINIETSRISFKGKLESSQYTQETHFNEKSTQTEFSNIFDLLSECIETLRKMDRRRIETKQTCVCHQLLANQINTCKNTITKLLESVDNLGYVVAALNGTGLNYIYGTKSTIYLDQQDNYICLKDTNTADDHAKQLDTGITKQRTDQWLELRKESRITGSTMFGALGLGTLKDQQEHFDRVHRGIEKPVSDELQKLFDYGTSQEINALCTLLGKIFPVYFPQLLLKEDGCEVIPLGDDGTGVDKQDCYKVSFEFKCSFPGKKYATGVHYSLLIYYTTQVSSRMATKGCSNS